MRYRIPPVPRSSRVAFCVVLGCLATGVAPAQQPAAAYRNDFSAAQTGGLPEDLQAVSGAFAVAEFEGQKVLELPGEPLDTFGLLFGPGEVVEGAASARVWGDTSGRRFPEFGLGLGDLGGYRVMVLPGQKTIEVRKGDDKIAVVPLGFEWKPKTWTAVALRVVKSGEGKWRVEGRAWPAGDPEPAQWSIAAEVIEQPPAGRASVWGIPFSGRPIRFDDLAVAPASDQAGGAK